MREHEARQKLNPNFNEYGIVAEGWHLLVWSLKDLAVAQGRPQRPSVPARTSGLGGDDEEEDDDQGVEEAVATLRSEVSSIGMAVRELAGVVGELRTNPPAALLPPLSAASGDTASSDDPDAQPIGLAEAKAMRKVVEALDAKLTRKLQAIDERLARRDLPKKAANGTRSRPASATGSGGSIARSVAGPPPAAAWPSARAAARTSPGGED